MRMSSFSNRVLRATGVAAIVLTSSLALTARQRAKFLSDDPLMREPETQDAAKTQSWDIGLTADLTLNLFGKPGDPTPNVKAQNINTIDEVPDSGWFTNRIYAKPLTATEVGRGSTTSDGPAPGKWTLIRAKSAGTAPGFTIRDDKNETWFITLDADGNPVAATAANVIASRLFWALGYYQVETHIASIRPENVVIGDKVTIPSHGRRRAFTRSDLHDVFKRSHRNGDGSYRVVAARALPGRVIGGFRYYGTRPDDPNDVVPHEHRRELRALQVFGGWTNLVDMKAGNTLDTVVTENGRNVVRHYLQDVGSTFGTGALHPREGDATSTSTRARRPPSGSSRSASTSARGRPSTITPARTSATSPTRRTCPTSGSRACPSRRLRARGLTTRSGRRSASWRSPPSTSAPR
jgi:hypothetical protein